MNDIAIQMQNDFGEFLPDLLAALAVLLIGWLIAWGVSKLVGAVLRRTSIDEKLARKLAKDGETPPNTEKLISKIVFWVLMILVLIAFFQTLGLGLVTGPLDGAVTDIFGYLPNLLSAALLMVVAWILARLVRFAVRSGAEKANLDEKLAAKTEDDPQTPATARGPSLSNTLGETAYWLILLLFLPAVLDALAIDSITKPASQMVDRVMAAIPNLFAAIILVAIAYFVGKILAGFISGILASVGFDGMLNRIGLIPRAAREPSADGTPKTLPSELVGRLVMVILIFFAVIEATELLGFDMLSSMLTELAMFAGDVLLAVVVFGIGLYLSKLAAEAIESSGVQNAETLATAARAGIVILTAAMALRQAGIGEDIIILAFGLTLGAVAVASAIAFGIGGREIAKRQLEEWVEKAKDGEAPKQLPPA